MWGVVTRRRKLAFAAGLTVALLGAGYLLIANGHRLEPGSSYWHGPDVEVRTAGPSTELRHTVDPGGEVEFGASIRNPGPWPVVITDVALAEGPQEQYAFKVTRVTMIYSDGLGGLVYGPAAATPFSATEVAAGAELSVFLTVAIPEREMAPGSSVYFHELVVGYRVLGIPRRQGVPMHFYVTLHAAAA